MAHKKFQHLIKCLAIYLAQRNKKAEKKTERKKEKRAYLAIRPNSSPPWPKPTWTPLVFFLRGGKQLGGRHAAAATPPACLVPPEPSSHAWRRLSAVPIHS